MTVAAKETHMSSHIKTTYPDLLWAGSEHSLLIASEAHGRMVAGVFGSRDEDEDDEKPYMLSVQDGIGIVSIRGPLVNRDSPYNRYFGVSSYADIRRAVMHAAMDPEIRGILLDIDSGGGAVSGVADTGDLIKAINKDIKPVWAYADGTMASAAYWIGCSASKVYSAKTSITGSIGVICTHMEYSKALKEAGVGVTVIRAGEYKALVNSVEQLSEVALRQMQDQLNAAYGVFIGHVAAARGTTVNLADQKMGQGREFFGEQALAAGLVDGIESFDSVLGKFINVTLDKSRVTLSNTGKYTQGASMATQPSKQGLTPQQIAALAAGAPAAETPAPLAAETPPAQPAAETLPAPETPAAPAAETKPADAGVVAFLQTQLAAAQEQVLNLKLELNTAQTTITSMKASHEGLVKIAAQSLGNMKIALGMPAVDLSKLPTESLLAEHSATTETFKSAFKAGGVAAVNTEEPKAETVDPNWRHRVAATRFTNN